MNTTEQAIRTILRCQRSTLWGRAWDISDDDGLNGCVNFLMGFIDDVNAMSDHIRIQRGDHATL